MEGAGALLSSPHVRRVHQPVGFTGAFAVLLAWILAVFLLRSANRDRLTVLFAAVLFVEGAVLVTVGAGVVMLFNLKPPRDSTLPTTLRTACC